MLKFLKQLWRKLMPTATHVPRHEMVRHIDTLKDVDWHRAPYRTRGMILGDTNAANDETDQPKGEQRGTR
jgi:hypothetical protein